MFVVMCPAHQTAARLHIQYKSLSLFLLNLPLSVRLPVGMVALNVLAPTSYTPTTSEPRGANTTLLPTATAPANLLLLVTLPVETDASNVTDCAPERVVRRRTRANQEQRYDPA